MSFSTEDQKFATTLLLCIVFVLSSILSCIRFSLWAFLLLMGTSLGMIITSRTMWLGLQDTFAGLSPEGQRGEPSLKLVQSSILHKQNDVKAAKLCHCEVQTWLTSWAWPFAAVIDAFSWSLAAFFWASSSGWSPDLKVCFTSATFLLTLAPRPSFACWALSFMLLTIQHNMRIDENATDHAVQKISVESNATFLSLVRTAEADQLHLYAAGLLLCVPPLRSHGFQPLPVETMCWKLAGSRRCLKPKTFPRQFRIHANYTECICRRTCLPCPVTFSLIDEATSLIFSVMMLKKSQPLDSAFRLWISLMCCNCGVKVSVWYWFSCSRPLWTPHQAESAYTDSALAGNWDCTG